VIQPSLMLALVFALFIGSAVIVRARRLRQHRRLRRLAVAHRLHSSPVDRFGLTERTREEWLADSRPIDVNVLHVMYGLDGKRRRFVYAVEFLLGGAMPRRAQRVIEAHESADESGAIPLELVSVKPVQGAMLDAFKMMLESKPVVEETA